MDQDVSLYLAPMVRICTLPMRLIALDFGAIKVYSQETIDSSMLLTKRIVNEKLQTIEYIMETGCIVFKTTMKEKNHVIFQMGTSNPEKSLKVAQMIQNDVAGIDINMGCPKNFSIKGGMGADLLNHPEKVKKILSNLVNNLKIPISCKIRLIKNKEKCIELIKLIESTGVCEIAIHGRTRLQRPSEPNDDKMIAELSKHVNIPVVANGCNNTCNSYQDVMEFAIRTNCSRVMIARNAIKDPSIFSPTKFTITEILTKYINYAIQFENGFNNTKYCVHRIMKSGCNEFSNQFCSDILACQNYKELCNLWSIKFEGNENLGLQLDNVHEDWPIDNVNRLPILIMKK
ncbi:Dihydrouridine synthase 2 [Intoshia linei]|uniref:Dihydrouridine synthase 2 n=1 Tax=Intoshia linei TaxID=1819745 RepID=A0A177AUG3_9BILA|nr:Dihydrouridine synthase 2 [Intoshia linei]